VRADQKHIEELYHFPLDNQHISISDGIFPGSELSVIFSINRLTGFVVQFLAMNDFSCKTVQTEEHSIFQSGKACMAHLIVSLTSVSFPTEKSVSVILVLDITKHTTYIDMSNLNFENDENRLLLVT
jgi:hypothetical protein